MENFLEKFSSTIQNRQVQQILKKLNIEKTAGEFQNSKEFQEKFRNLINDLVGKELSSSLVVYPAYPLERTNVDQYNDMIENAYNSLVASFEGLGKIEEVQNRHQFAIKDIILKNINSSINELKTKLNLYSFIENNNYGFEDGIYSTFNEAKTNTTLGLDGYLHRDERTTEVKLENADIDYDYSEALHLKTLDQTEVNIVGIRQEFGGEFKESLLKSIEDPEENLNLIIDSKKGTYWKQTIRRSQPNEIVKVKLVLDLAGTRQINYLEIDSIFKNRMDKISYLDSDGTINEILSTNEYIDLKSNTKVVFSEINTERLYLEFTIKENTEKEFSEKDINNFNPLRFIAPDWAVVELLELADESSDIYKYYEYKIGIDNIRVGLHTYKEKSVYTSKELFLKDEVGTLGLTTKERRPYLDNETLKFATIGSDSEDYLSSIEYWVIRENLDSENEKTAIVLKTDIFPIFPLKTEKIYHETLVLSSSSVENEERNNPKDIGNLNHFPDLTPGKTPSLYRSGVLMDENQYELTAQPFANNGTKMNCKIQIFSQSPGDIFTVTYTPMRGNCYSNKTTETNLEQVDLTGDMTARVGPDGLILLDENPDKRVKAYRVYLKIIIRQNTALKTATSFLDEYRLCTGKRNLSKFEET